MILRTLEYYYSKILKKIKGSAIKNVKIHPTSKIEAGSTVINSKIEKYSYCGYNCTLINVEVGAFCSIADNVLIGQASHSLEWVSTSPVFREKKDSVKKKYFHHPIVEPLKISIGNDVWIGEGVKIKSGVKIGNGVVVGMGSIVTKDLESYGIYAGNPAKIIKKRFSNEIIEKLEKICWWNFDDKTLYKIAPYINDPIRFIEEVEKL